MLTEARIVGCLRPWSRTWRNGGYGNRKVILVSDGEAAIKAVKDKIIALREAETIPEETPVGEHNANLAEGMVRRVRE